MFYYLDSNHTIIQCTKDMPTYMDTKTSYIDVIWSFFNFFLCFVMSYLHRRQLFQNFFCHARASDTDHSQSEEEMSPSHGQLGKTSVLVQISIVSQEDNSMDIGHANSA